MGCAERRLQGQRSVTAPHITNSGHAFLRLMRSLLSFQTFDHYLVYWIAPTVGAVLATVLFAVFQASFLDERKKNKAD